MEKMEGYDEAEAFTGEYETIEAGGYICIIKGAKEEKSKTSGKRMLVIALDIAEGEHKDYYQKIFDNKSKSNDPSNPTKWASGGIYRQMLEGNKATEFLKGLMTSLEESNSGFKWNWDEKKLTGLKCGAIFGQEEYEKNDGSVGTTTKVKWIRSTKTIKDGNFTIPETKKLPTKGESFEEFSKSNGLDINDGEDLPF